VARLERLFALASRAEVAIENAQLLRNANRELRQAFSMLELGRADARALFELSEQVGRLASLDESIDVLSQGARKLLGADFAAIAALDTTGGPIQWRGGAGTRQPMRDTSRKAPGDAVYEQMAAQQVLWIPNVAEELRQNPDRFPHLEREHAASALIVPFPLSAGRFGILLAGYRTRHARSEREQQLAQAIGQLAAAALEKTELLEQAQIGERRAKALYQAAGALTSTLELAPMLQQLCRRAVEAFQAEGCCLLLLEPSGELAVTAQDGFPSDRADRIASLRIPNGTPSLATAALNSGETQIVLDATTDPRANPRLVELFGWHSIVVAPLMAKGRRLGVMAVGHPGRRHFTAEDQKTLATLASQAAAAISHAQVFAELRARKGVAELEARIAATAAASLDLNAVLQTICTESAGALNVDRVGIWLAEQAGVLKRVAEVGTPAPANVSTTLILGSNPGSVDLGKGRLLSQLKVRVPALAGSLLSQYEVADAIFVPFGTRQQLMGVLAITDLHEFHRFGEADVQMAEAIARQAQLAIANALAYRDQQQAIRRLGELNRMKANFLTTMRHELRTPLNSILGFSDLLQNRLAGDLTPKQERYVRNIRDAGGHLLELVDDILEYSLVQSREQLERQVISVDPLIREIAELFASRAASKGVRLDVESAPELSRISGDPTRLSRALGYLVENAIKFTESEGRVTVQAAERDGFVEIAVRDTGPGIAPEDQARIFQPFVQADGAEARRSEGTGLGLAIAARILELHGGSIELESAPGRGSTFTMRLPAHRTEDAA